MRGCCDDYCYGGLQCIETGTPMLDVCPDCKKVVEADTGIGCECEPEYDGDEQAEGDDFDDEATR